MKNEPTLNRVQTEYHKISSLKKSKHKIKRQKLKAHWKLCNLLVKQKPENVQSAIKIITISTKLMN